MTRRLADWSEDDKRAAVQRVWTDPPLKTTELGTAVDDMTAWLESAYLAEPWPRRPLD